MLRLIPALGILALACFGLGCADRDATKSETGKYSQEGLGQHVGRSPADYVIRWYSSGKKDFNGVSKCVIGAKWTQAALCQALVEKPARTRLGTVGVQFMSLPIALLDGGLSCGTKVCRLSDRRSALIELNDECVGETPLARLSFQDNLVAVAVICRVVPAVSQRIVVYVDEDMIRQMDVSEKKFRYVLESSMK